MSQYFEICEYLLSWLRLTELIAFVIVYSLVALWCKYKWDRRPFEKLDAELTGPSAYPIIGSGLHFIGRPEDIMAKLFKIHRTYGPEPFRIWMGTCFNVVISKPEDIQNDIYILDKASLSSELCSELLFSLAMVYSCLQIILNSSKALNKGPFYKFFGNLIGEGLFSAPVDKWRRHRRMIGPVFQIKNLKQFFDVFNEETKMVIEDLRKEVGKTQPFDLLNYIEINSLKIVCRTAMGYNIDIQSSIGREFLNSVKKVFEIDSMRVYQPWLHSNTIYSIYSTFMGLSTMCSNAKKLPNKVIQNAKQSRAQNKIKTHSMSADIDNTYDNKKQLHDLLNSLFDLNKRRENFSDDEIRDEVMTMMLAGTDTSALAECFCFLLLAIHPEIQDKVYNEIYEILGDMDQPITVEDTQQLVYLDQVLKETLRMFPIGPVFDRLLEDQVQISSGNYILPKGTMCTVSPMVTHYLPELYPNPTTFNPDNFTQENMIKRHKYSFIAFSGGPRGCIGNQFAMFKMKIVVANVIRNFSIHTDIKMDDIKLTWILIMRSKNGFPVTIRPRKRNPHTL